VKEDLDKHAVDPDEEAFEQVEKAACPGLWCWRWSAIHRPRSFAQMLHRPRNSDSWLSLL
jgi:hypothetical protein